MKNKYYVTALFVVMFMATVFSVMPTSASASPKGNAYGYWDFPGNSAYGRSQNTNNFTRKYTWNSSEFGSYQELLEYIRAYLYEWKSGGTFDDDNSEIDISTKNATKIDDDRATLQGEVDLNSSDFAHTWFTYGKSLTSFTQNTPTTYVEEESDSDFSYTVTNLDAKTRYYFKAVGEDEDGEREYGKTLSFVTDSRGGGNSNDDDDWDDDNEDEDWDDEDENDNGDDPSAKTLSATNIENTSADIHGEVDMNDFENGTVFFVYGEDGSQIEDVENDYDAFSDIDEDGENLGKAKIDSGLDDSEEYTSEFRNLRNDTTYYYAIGVEYEDEDGDDTIILGSVKSFTTGDSDTDSSDTEPDVITGSVTSIDTDSADIRGEVDMNDFDSGIVFLVYGEDDSQIEDIEDDYSTYADIDEDSDDLQKVKVDSDLDDDGVYTANVFGLDSETVHFYAFGVQYEDEDGDDVIILGNVKSFTTK